MAAGLRPGPRHRAAADLHGAGPAGRHLLSSTADTDGPELADEQDAREALQAQDVEVVLPGGRRILGPASLTVAPGTFTALLGPSGSGKSTLLRAMAGLTVPSAGTVRLGGDPAELRVEDLGYVPQRETVHDRLTVREALRYAAVLRLAPGADVTQVVDDVLDELDLRDQAATRIRDLSGGERRRAACGLELVGRPAVLLLDEPTSGLDPVLERRLMLMFRRLADQGLAVVVVTHATASLGLCDEVAVLRAGGEIAFAGRAVEAIVHLDRVARDAEAHDAERHDHTAPAVRSHGTGPIRHRPFALELRTLTARYRRTLWRDTRTLVALVAQAPIIGALIALLFAPRALSRAGTDPGDAAQLVFLLMTGAIWLGVTSACREVIKERGIVERELDVGLRLDAYVLAKAAVLFVLSAAQATLMVLVVVVLQPTGEPAGHLLVLLGLCILVTWTSVAVGLVVSTLARSVDQAASVVPLVLMPQLLFAGALVPLGRMPRGVEALAQLTYSRWAYAGMGSAIDMGGRLDRDTTAASALGFDRGFFALGTGASAAVLGTATLLGLLICVLLLNRRALPED